MCQIDTSKERLGRVGRFVIILLFLGCTMLHAETEDPRFLKAGEAYESKDFDTAFELWKQLSEEGDAESTYYLGVMYMIYELPVSVYSEFLGTDKDPQEVGISLIEDAAKKSSPDALSMIASFYERGFSKFDFNSAKAMQLREAAAETGDALAQYNLGVILLENAGEENQIRAYKLFKSAAQKKLFLAYFNLGVIHFKRNTEPDNLKAYAWFQKVLDWKPTKDVRGLSGQMQAANIAKEALNQLKNIMSDEQILEAKKNVFEHRI